MIKKRALHSSTHGPGNIISGGQDLRGTGSPVCPLCGTLKRGLREGVSNEAAIRSTLVVLHINRVLYVCGMYTVCSRHVNIIKQLVT